MITRRGLAGLVAAGAASSASAATAPSSILAGRRAEAHALRTFAEATHPRGLHAAADADWRKHWDDLVLRADQLSDGAYFGSLMRGLGWFKDGHTNVLPSDFTGGDPEALKAGPIGRKAPFRTRAFHDGLFVIEAGTEAAPLLGGRIIAINGASDRDIMRRLVALWPSNNEAWGHRWAPYLLGSAGGLQAADIIQDAEAPVRILADVGGRRIEVTVRYRPEADKALKPMPRTPSEREAWTARYGRGNYVHPLPRSRLVYVSIDEMADVEGMTFEAMTRQLFAAIERPGVQRLVLDISRNGGGDNFHGEPLRKGLERSRFNRPGGLYVVTGPSTFSAAQNLATRLERETHAIFVGEPTSGSPNHYGDARPIQGQATGLTAIVSTRPWFDSYPADTRPWIMPDLFVPDTFEAWREGRDLALARILTHTAAGQPDDFASHRTYYFARPSQSAPWAPFWRT